MNPWIPAFTIARTHRLERKNRLWRFSPAKAGLWLVLFHLAWGSAAVYNVHSQPIGLTPMASLAMMYLQASLWSLLTTVINERDRLYRSRRVELVHISPTAGWGLPLGMILSDLPQRAWTLLIWAALLVGPGMERVWMLPILCICGLVASALGQLTSTIVLIAWVRTWPHLLTGLWVLMIAAGVSLVAAFGYVVVRPDIALAAAASLGHLVEHYVGPLAGGLMAVGILGSLWVAAYPDRFGEMYRESWLKFTETARDSSRRPTSRWLALVGGTAGAVQAKEWIVLARNPLTWLRVGLLIALAAAIVAFRDWLSPLAPTTRHLLGEAVPLGATLFIVGEIAAASMQAERRQFALYVVAGISPGRLLWGKILAMSPIALVAALMSYLLGHSFFGGALRGLALVAILLGVGTWDVSRTVGTSEPEEMYQQLFEQVPTGLFSQIGIIVAMLFAAAQVWGPPFLAALAWGLPVLALALGGLRLRAAGMRR